MDAIFLEQIPFQLQPKHSQKEMSSCLHQSLNFLFENDLLATQECRAIRLSETRLSKDITAMAVDD